MRRPERSGQLGRRRRVLTRGKRYAARNVQRKRDARSGLRSHGTQHVSTMALRATGRAFMAWPIGRTLIVVLHLPHGHQADDVFREVESPGKLQPEHERQYPHHDDQAQPSAAERGA